MSRFRRVNFSHLQASITVPNLYAFRFFFSFFFFFSFSLSFSWNFPMIAIWTDQIVPIRRWKKNFGLGFSPRTRIRGVVNRGWGKENTFLWTKIWRIFWKEYRLVAKTEKPAEGSLELQRRASTVGSHVRRLRLFYRLASRSIKFMARYYSAGVSACS